MKYFIITLISLFLFANSTNVQAKKNEIVIGTVKDNANFQLNGISILKNYWEDLFKKNKVTEKVDNFTIEKHVDLETQKEYYIVLGYNEANHTKVAFEIFKKGDKFIFNQQSLNKMCVVCFGTNATCSQLCQINGEWACGKVCTEDCKKLVAVYIVGNNLGSIRSFKKAFK